MAVLPAEVCGPAHIPDRIDCKSNRAAASLGLSNWCGWKSASSSSAAARISGSAGMREATAARRRLRRAVGSLLDGIVETLKQGRIVERVRHW